MQNKSSPWLSSVRPSGRVVVGMADTNDRYRQFCKRLVALGFTQKTLASAIDISPAWVSDWLKGKYVLDANGIDGLNRYLDRLRKELDRRPSSDNAMDRKAV
jgi:transcriptional regulator with XRE-family HTH domain